jgi:hypothetical protein
MDIAIALLLLVCLGRYFTTSMSSSTVLNLNLPGNLDHILGLQIESIDYLY